MKENSVSIFSSSLILFKESNGKQQHKNQQTKTKGRLVSEHSPLCFAFTAGEISERKRNAFPFALAEGKQDLRPDYLGLSLPFSIIRDLCFEKS